MRVLARDHALPPEAYAVLSAALAFIGAPVVAAGVRNGGQGRPTPRIRRAS